MLYHFIINQHSKAGKTILTWKKIKQVLFKKQINYLAYFTEYEGHAVLLTRHIITHNSGKKTIVIIGGDGTVNEVINGVTRYEDITIGYIPSGSGNDLSRGLKISRDPIIALNRILNPKKFQYIDYGILTYFNNQEKMQRKFIVSSGIGYDADVCHAIRISKLKVILNKIGLGKFAYLLLGIQKIIVSQLFDSELLINGIERKKLKNILFIASMIQPYEGGGLKMAPSSKNNDGLFTVCIVSNISKFKVFLMIPALIFRKHEHMQGIQMITCKSIEIKIASPHCIHTDGECISPQNHIHLACRKKQIRIIV